MIVKGVIEIQGVEIPFQADLDLHEDSIRSAIELENKWELKPLSNEDIVAEYIMNRGISLTVDSFQFSEDNNEDH